MGLLQTSKSQPTKTSEFRLKSELASLGEAVQKCMGSGTFIDATEAFAKGVTAWVAFLAEYFEMRPQRTDPILISMESCFQRFADVISSLSLTQSRTLSRTELLELERFLEWNKKRSQKLEMFLNRKPQFLEQYASLQAPPRDKLCDLALTKKG